MKIGIIGYGFVGKALAAGLNDDVSLLKIDPKLNTNINDLIDFKPNAIFICVPTPMNEDFSQDISILKDAIKKLNELNLQSLIIIKSTVLPKYIIEIEKQISEFIYNPEFLREKHANQDFIESKLIVFGENNTSAKKLEEIYRDHSKCICKDYIYTDAIAASLIKYTINSFLATKVTFFNELNSLFNQSGTEESWDNFILAIANDPRIGNSHMQVPGHDGRLGFGGACLPKDSNAFNIYSEEVGEPLSLLKKVIKTNNKIRAKYNVKTLRELEQNIKYDEE
jgi:nucleotide sugar dehydrogenase